MLQTCSTAREAYPINVFIAKSLFSNFDGAFVIAKKSSRDFEIIDQWGQERNICPLFSVNDPPLTISVGLAEAPTHGATAKAIIHSADKALYIAKQSGRNRVQCANLSELPF